MTNTNTKESNKEILDMMYELLGKLNYAKSQVDKNKGDILRLYSIVITLIEQCLGYYKTWIIDSVYFPTKYEE